MKSNANFKRLVIKLGSSIITDKDNRFDYDLIKSIAGQVSFFIDQGKEIVLVSSGAIACGLEILHLTKRPKELVELSAIASIGQIALMRGFQDCFKAANRQIAQVLLTWDDFDSRRRFLNAKKTINKLLAHKLIPVINENDSISTEEIKFGDNDKLSALVANLLQADALVLLTDVDGLYDRKSGELIKWVEKVDSGVLRLACGAEKFTCVGGMYTKLEAIKIANLAGVPAYLANGRTKDSLIDIAAGKNPGTYFCAGGKQLARKSWIASGAKPKGVILVDDGAKEALSLRNKSLLSVGIVSTSGEFKEGSVVLISDKHGNNFAKGITRLSSQSINQIKGKRSEREVIHRDDLVII